MDPAKILLQRTSMELGQFYKAKGDQSYWKFVHLDSKEATFEHRPLFQEPDQDPVIQKVVHSDLHHYKLAGDPPQLVPTEAMEPLLPQNSKPVQMERIKSIAANLLHSAYNRSLGCK